MSSSSREITFQDVLFFHKQLRTLSDAGLLFDLKIGPSGLPFSAKLELIETRLALELGKGQRDKGVVEAIAQANEIPEIYGLALASWVQCDQPVEALKALHEPAVSRSRIAANFRYSIMQPLIVLTLVYFGMLYMSIYTTPRLESIHMQIRQPLSSSLEILVAIKRAMHIWGPAVPALIVLIAIWCRQRSTRSRFAWLPGSTQLDATVRNANFAESTACLLDAGQSMQQTTASSSVVRPVRDVGELSALLRWALASPVPEHERSKLLRSVARVYRQSEIRQSTRLQSALPVVVSALFGGFLVLGYGLGLFAPVVQLVNMLSLP